MPSRLFLNEAADLCLRSSKNLSEGEKLCLSEKAKIEGKVIKRRLSVDEKLKKWPHILGKSRGVTCNILADREYPDKILVMKSGGEFRVYANGVVAEVKRSWDDRNPFSEYEFFELRYPRKYLGGNECIVVSWSQLIAQRDHPEVVSYERRKYDKESGEVWVRDERADYLLYKDNLYRVAGGYTKDQQVMLVKSQYLKEDKKFQRLKKELEYFERFSAAEKKAREPIPEEVRIFVWRRDGGRCVKCGSQENLEFDHIIPLSKRGSNTERNVQILCQACNKSKADHI